MANQQSYADIIAILDDYFDGLYHADIKRLAKVFHPDARYINMIANDYMNKSRADYFTMVERRTPPSSRNEPREDYITSIEFGGENMAFVRASMTMMNREYLDFLTLTNDHHGWRIMTKVFTYTAKTETNECLT